MKNIVNVKKAAKLLSNFDMKAAAVCKVQIHFYDRKAKKIFLHKIESDYRHRFFLTWSQTQWEQFIADGVRHYLETSKLVPSEVLSVAVTFKIQDKPGMATYQIENTNLGRYDKFNRTIIAKNSCTQEIFLSFKEKDSVHSITDVVEVMNAASDRAKKVKSDLPFCCTVSPAQISKNLI